MNHLNFAPNETLGGSLQALQELLRPWSWYSHEHQSVRNQFSQIFSSDPENTFFLLSARSALYGVLLAMHLPQKSEIIVPGFTCEAVVLPILALGHTPRYVDIETKTFSLDIKDLKKKTNDNTRVIILQHSFAMTPHFRNEILAWAKSRNISVIEDMAHGWQLPENADHPDSQEVIKITSFGRSKMLSTVHGGAISIPQSKLRDAFATWHEQLPSPSYSFIIRSLLYKFYAPIIVSTYSLFIGKVLHAFALKVNMFTMEISSQEKNGTYDPWLAKKYPAIMSRLLETEITKFKSNIASRCKTARYYNENLGDSYDPENLPLLRYPVLLTSPKQCDEMLKHKNITLGDWYQQPVAPIQVPLPKMLYSAGDCPVAESVCARIRNLPLRVTDSDREEIIQAVRKSV